MNLSRHLQACLLMAMGTVGSGPAFAGELADTRWHVTLSTSRLGPVETKISFEQHGDLIYAHSNSGVVDLIREFPGAGELSLSGDLFSFNVSETAEGFEGEMLAPWPGEQLSPSNRW